jgi:hypothetical protein
VVVAQAADEEERRAFRCLGRAKAADQEGVARPALGPVARSSAIP